MLLVHEQDKKMNSKIENFKYFLLILQPYTYDAILLFEWSTTLGNGEIQTSQETHIQKFPFQSLSYDVVISELSQVLVELCENLKLQYMYQIWVLPYTSDFVYTLILQIGILCNLKRQVMHRIYQADLRLYGFINKQNTIYLQII